MLDFEIKTRPLTTGLISVANNKVFCKTGSGSVVDLTQDTNTIYTHPSTIQCNASTEINNLKSSVSNGKTQVANAITGKGVAASGSDTFATLANKIGQISASLSGSSIVACGARNSSNSNPVSYSLSTEVNVIVVYDNSISLGTIDPNRSPSYVEEQYIGETVEYNGKTYNLYHASASSTQLSGMKRANASGSNRTAFGCVLYK